MSNNQLLRWLGTLLIALGQQAWIKTEAVLKLDLVRTPPSLPAEPEQYFLGMQMDLNAPNQGFLTLCMNCPKQLIIIDPHIIHPLDVSQCLAFTDHTGHGPTHSYLVQKEAKPSRRSNTHAS